MFYSDGIKGFISSINENRDSPLEKLLSLTPKEIVDFASVQDNLKDDIYDEFFFLCKSLASLDLFREKFLSSLELNDKLWILNKCVSSLFSQPRFPYTANFFREVISYFPVIRNVFMYPIKANLRLMIFLYKDISLEARKVIYDNIDGFDREFSEPYYTDFYIHSFFSKSRDEEELLFFLRQVRDYEKLRKSTSWGKYVGLDIDEKTRTCLDICNLLRGEKIEDFLDIEVDAAFFRKWVLSDSFLLDDPVILKKIDLLEKKEIRDCWDILDSETEVTENIPLPLLVSSVVSQQRDL